MDKKYNFQKTENQLKEFWEQEEIYKYQNGKYKKFFPLTLPANGKWKTSYRTCIFLYTGRNNCQV